MRSNFHVQTFFQKFPFLGKNKIGPKDSAPIFIACPVNFFFTKKLPVSVSLTANPCDHATNNLKIIDNRPLRGGKKKFGVCSKYILYEERNFTIRFIEWVKLLQILGVEKIHLYNKHVHPDFLKVLKKLERKGIIEVWPFLEPSDIYENKPYTIQRFLIEMASINDCLYRTMHLYEYIAFIDPDEVIIPVRKEDRTWSDLLQNFEPIDRRFYHSISAENLYFPPNDQTPFSDIPKYHYMLQNVQVKYLKFKLISNAFKTIF